MPYSIEALQDGCYPGTTVLINKLGLQKQEHLSAAESVAVTLHTAEIEAEAPQEPFTFAFYCKLHERLFGDIYDWAGQLRTVNLSKKGTQFYPAEILAVAGKRKFELLQRKKEFRGMPRTELIKEIAALYDDLNQLHPFREGNGRTQRLFFTLLIRRAGYDIDFAECDTDELMMATIYAARGVLDYLEAFFDATVKEIL